MTQYSTEYKMLMQITCSFVEPRPRKIEAHWNSLSALVGELKLDKETNIFQEIIALN